VTTAYESPDPPRPLDRDALLNLSLAELAEHLKQVTATKDALRVQETALRTELDRRLGAAAQHVRREKGKTTGTVRFEVDGFIVIADLPKRPEYDQGQLRNAVETLRIWGEDPEEYVTLEIKVAETKYKAWPPVIRQLFEPARTVRTGPPRYRLERLDLSQMPPAANDEPYEETP
jgi:hypothetical protein